MNRQLNVVIASNNWSELKFKFKFKSRMFAKYVTQKVGWNFSGPKTTLQNQVQVKTVTAISLSGGLACPRTTDQPITMQGPTGEQENLNQEIPHLHVKDTLSLIA